MRVGAFCCLALLAATACGSDARDAREPGELLSGELTGRASGEPFPIQYGSLTNWEDPYFERGARLSFYDRSVTCDGSYVKGESPDFAAWIDVEVDPQSDQDWNGPNQITYYGSEDHPRMDLHYQTGQLHLDRVDEHSASGHVSWGGPEPSGEVYSLEGTFEVERCHEPFAGD
jgi:hypothetical protein